MSLTCSHMWVHVGHTWDTRYTRVFARPHMCFTCEKLSPHVGKLVKLEQHMWDTFLKHLIHMWAPWGSNAIFP